MVDFVIVGQGRTEVQWRVDIDIAVAHGDTFGSPRFLPAPFADVMGVVIRDHREKGFAFCLGQELDRIICHTDIFATGIDIETMMRHVVSVKGLVLNMPLAKIGRVVAAFLGLVSQRNPRLVLAVGLSPSAGQSAGKHGITLRQTNRVVHVGTGETNAFFRQGNPWPVS